MIYVSILFSLCKTHFMSLQKRPAPSRESQSSKRALVVEDDMTVTAEEDDYSASLSLTNYVGTHKFSISALASQKTS